MHHMKRTEQGVLTSTPKLKLTPCNFRMGVCTDTGEEKLAVEQLSQLRITVDTIGGTAEADNLRLELDKRLTECYRLLTGKRPQRDPLFPDERG